MSAPCTKSTVVVVVARAISLYTSLELSRVLFFVVPVEATLPHQYNARRVGQVYPNNAKLHVYACVHVCVDTPPHVLYILAGHSFPQHP